MTDKTIVPPWRLTVRSQKEERVVDSWAPFYCVDFFLYFQTFEVVELGFMGLKFSEELEVTGSSHFAARVHLPLPRCSRYVIYRYGSWRRGLYNNLSQF